ncbi:MAG: BTAD domain-containing putative transcriptional regulator [Paracoccaceae bacterium]
MLAPPDSDGTNAALFASFADTAFIDASLSAWQDRGGFFLMSPDASQWPGIDAVRLPFAASLPDSPEAASDTILADLHRHAAENPGMACLIVDMGWSLNVVWGAAMIERWGSIVENFVQSRQIAVISLYDTETLVEDQLAAAFRSHRYFASPSGLHENPHWLPPALIATATVEEQYGFLLGRIVPEMAGRAFSRRHNPALARGATPNWVPGARQGLARPTSAQRWHIHCLGSLRVFVAGNAPVDWAIAGAAPKKSRALFAYLLTHGDKGCHTDTLGEFLWPDAESEEAKRARLRHTLAMLRKSLGGSDTILRSGESYRLNIPEGSWIDIQAFEQLCRRGLSLLRHRDHRAAIRVYEAAERLYQGDLFADLPVEYVQSEFHDWCMPRRIWLHDMAVKLHYDHARALLAMGRPREAQEQAQEAVRLDPANANAHIEVMRCFAAQGRHDATRRQFYLYQQAAEQFADPDEIAHVRAEMEALFAGPRDGAPKARSGNRDAKA